MDRLGNTSIRLNLNRVGKKRKADILNRNPSGDYDFGKQRLTNIGQAVEDDDAISKKHFEQFGVTRGRPVIIPTSKKAPVLLLHRRLTRLLDPIEATDAVTKQFLEKNCVFVKGDEIDGDEKRIVNLKPGKDDNDAITFKQLQRCLSQLEDKELNEYYYNAMGLKIKNLKDPLEPQDAATRNWVNIKIGNEIDVVMKYIDEKFNKNKNKNL